MKRTFIFTLAIVIALIFTGCASVQPADLTGEWTQKDADSNDTYMVAAITEETIEVYWYTAEDSTKALYWAGSYVAPTEAGDYTWDSENDTEKTSAALLASGDATKTFTYSAESGEITFDVSMLGVTTTVALVADGE